MPRAVQLRRTKGWRMPADTISVARPGPFGNPFLVSIHGQEHAVELHRAWLLAGSAADLGYTGEQAALLDERRSKVYRLMPELRGKNLACFCPEPDGDSQDCCHRAILLKLANE